MYRNLSVTDSDKYAPFQVPPLLEFSVIMASDSCLNHEWQTLYRAAILETGKNLVPQWVSEAEEAVADEKSFALTALPKKERRWRMRSTRYVRPELLRRKPKLRNAIEEIHDE
ncbi:MAG: hypothetical protein C5B55_07460 [Blastocatellia bacterium]|nr:MAG: hypothetical protein C5B55_07460 [Blastocatellia bacterium]